LTKSKPIFTDNSTPYQLPGGDFLADGVIRTLAIIACFSGGLANPA
jgi:hypothetical protein